MKNESPPKPTPVELSILGVLWERGPSTVREVHEIISKTKPIGYTGILKFLQIMTVKGSVRRNSDQRAHVYEAFQPEDKTKRQLVGDLMQRAFSGSASELVMHALAGKRTSQEEIDEIRRILDAHERKSK
ncbi:MAG: BlaI/MecI/CopY family transcriptional regulator [Rhodospirillaceae bacterium]